MSCCLALTLFLLSSPHSQPFNPPASALHQQNAPIKRATLSTFAQAHPDSLVHESSPPVTRLLSTARSSLTACATAPVAPESSSSVAHPTPARSPINTRLAQVLPSFIHSSTCLRTRWSRASTTSSRHPRPPAVVVPGAALVLDVLPPLPPLLEVFPRRRPSKASRPRLRRQRPLPLSAVRRRSWYPTWYVYATVSHLTSLTCRSHGTLIKPNFRYVRPMRVFEPIIVSHLRADETDPTNRAFLSILRCGC